MRCIHVLSHTCCDLLPGIPMWRVQGFPVCGKQITSLVLWTREIEVPSWNDAWLACKAQSQQGNLISPFVKIFIVIIMQRVVIISYVVQKPQLSNFHSQICMNKTVNFITDWMHIILFHGQEIQRIPFLNLQSFQTFNFPFWFQN